MKRLSAALLVGALILPTSCDDFLDVNTNPNAPQTVTANLYLPPMLHWMVTSPQFDGRFVGLYTQQWMSTSTAVSPPLTWGRMGYDPGSDNGGEQWRDAYWNFGQNLVDMISKAQAEERWDLLGVGMILKAWGVAGADGSPRRDHRQGSHRPDQVQLQLRHAGVRVPGSEEASGQRGRPAQTEPTAPSTRPIWPGATGSITATAPSGCGSRTAWWRCT